MSSCPLPCYERSKLLMQGKSQLAQPAITERLRLRRLRPYRHAHSVVILLASSATGFEFPSCCANAWLQLANDAAHQIAFAIYVERDGFASAEQRDFFLPFCFKHRIASAWGSFSLVRAELAALMFARREFPDARNFFVCSGDSMPTKPASEFARSFSQSLLAFHPQITYCDRSVSFHCQFKLLLRTDVDLLLQQHDALWDALEHENLELNQICGCCSLWFSDEYVIGQVLLQCGSRCGDVPGRDYGIMEFDLMSGYERPCGRPVYHAATLSFGSRRYDLAMKHARNDPYTFAIRKVKE